VAPSARLAHLEFFSLWLSLNLCLTSISIGTSRLIGDHRPPE
jgi:purine-cytosine permease-like protein